MWKIGQKNKSKIFEEFFFIEFAFLSIFDRVESSIMKSLQ